jgi:hypothetical protein
MQFLNPSFTEEAIRMKRNCWEIKKCGREKGSDICPSAIEGRLDGVHGGKNAGRSCWVVAGTFCGGNVQGTYAQKFTTCKSCEFYASVKKEEFPKFMLSATLLNKLA